MCTFVLNWPDRLHGFQEQRSGSDTAKFNSKKFYIVEGIYYIWIGGTYQTPSDYTWDDDPNSPTYGEEFCFSLIRTEWYMEAIIGNEIVRDGNYCEENLADGRPYNHIAFSLEEANSYIPVPKTIVY